MATEPVTIFARIADTAAVARLLREIAPDVQIDGPDDDWRQAIITFGKSKSVRTITFNNDPDYHAEPNWSEQMNGMRGFFARFPETERKPFVMSLTTTFRFSLGSLFEPDFDPGGDPRLDVLFAVAELLDGVLFTPSSLRDRNGRVLFSAGGEAEEDPEAIWPQVLGKVSLPPGRAPHEPSRSGESGDESDTAEAPSPVRVARRAIALGVVTMRAMLEREAHEPTAPQTHKHLIDWIRELGLEDELEPDESAVVQRRLGRLDSMQQINSTWRLEGLAVLTWALGKLELPAHDELVNPNDLWESLGVFDADAANALLTNPALRSREEIQTLCNRTFALHWRLRNYGLRPTVMDFADFARTCWFGPLDLTGLPLVKGDLAIGGKRLDRASKELFARTQSAAQERHQAINWLCEGPERYSDASTDT
jgi:hypothetical protein